MFLEILFYSKIPGNQIINSELFPDPWYQSMQLQRTESVPLPHSWHEPHSVLSSSQLISKLRLVLTGTMRASRSISPNPIIQSPVFAFHMHVESVAVLHPRQLEIDVSFVMLCAVSTPSPASPIRR